MRRMSPTYRAIVAMSENRVIGRDGLIPWRLPEDYRWFKRRTMGGTLVMGRKTYDGIGKTLPGRETVVVSRTGQIKGVTMCRELIELPRLLAGLPEPYWVAGGAELYHQLLNECRYLYLTRVKRTVEGDTFFPPFEDRFRLAAVIHENAEFRVERWDHPRLTDGVTPPVEAWLGA